MTNFVLLMQDPDPDPDVEIEVEGTPPETQLEEPVLTPPPTHPEQEDRW